MTIPCRPGLTCATDQNASSWTERRRPLGRPGWATRWASRPTRRSAAATSRSAASAPASSWPTCIWPPTPRPASRWSRSPRARRPRPPRWPGAGASAVSTTTPERLIEDREVEIVDIAFPPDQQPDLIRHALKQPHVKAILAQKPLALDLAEAEAIEAGVPRRRQGAVGQPEHALRPVDARAQAAARPRRPGRAGDRHDRDARDPALAGLPARLRPADAAQHEHPSPGRAALPVRRPDRDLHRRPPGPAHGLRPHRRHHRLDAAVPVGAARRVAGGCLVGAQGRGLPVRHLHQVAGRGHRGRGAGHDRLAGLPERQPVDPALLLAARHRRRLGRAELGHDVVPARLQGRDGPAAGRAARGQRARCSAGATTSRRWRWSRPATARCKEGRSVKLAELGY